MAKCSLLGMMAFEVVSPSGQSKGRLRNAMPQAPENEKIPSKLEEFR